MPDDAVQHVPVNGIWDYDDAGQVVAVTCHCGSPIYYGDAIHARIVLPKQSAARCRRCKRLVKVPVMFSEVSQ